MRLYFPHEWVISHVNHIHWFKGPNSINLNVKITKFLIMYFPSVSYFEVLLKSNV
jgi:hypothetical protein